MLTVIYIPSWGEASHTVPLSFGDWDVIFIAAGGSFLLVELGKWFFGRNKAQALPVKPGSSGLTVPSEGGK